MTAARQPRYVQIAQVLLQGIEADRHPVGSLLPTEAQLCRNFRVSRHTVREAIRHLKDQGILTSRKRVGTRVEAKRTGNGYVQSLHSLAEIFQYAQETRLDVVRRGRMEARGRLAEELGCRPGKAWLHIQAVRRAPGRARPICWTDIYVDRAFARIGREVGVARIAVYALIERHYGETIREVRQDIRAALIPARLADLLQAQASAPALMIVRRYVGSGGRILEVSRSLHPADRFAYSMRLKRDLRP